MIKNTSYKVHAGTTTDAERLTYNIEEGAIVTTESGVWMVYNNAWRKLYPQAGEGTGIGWVRYDDTQYTELNKLQLADQVTIPMPNNGGNIVRSELGLDYYNPITGKVISNAVNNVYVVTVVFKMSSANANQTHIDFSMSGYGDLNRVNMVMPFYKGNDTPQNAHSMVQFYTDQDFVDNGANFQIQAHGGTAKIWDIIYFIQKTQSYA
tara:strand:- start:220 stop:843 length:624 start_codon:yes stop_codon:yes gene_type:complete